MEAKFLPDGTFLDSWGRRWPIETVRAVQADRDFYTRPKVERSGFHRHPPYLVLLDDLANAYRRCGMLESAKGTEENAHDLRMVLGVT